MRLLHVIRSTDAESGGPIEALLRISEVLLQDGHEVEVVSLESAADIAERKFPFCVTGIGEGTRPYHFNPRLTPWLKKHASGFDAVLLHGLWNYSSLGAWRALRNGPTPYFIFAHGMMDPWFKKRYPLKHVAKQVFWLLGEGRVLRDAQSVLFTCEEERLRSKNTFWGFKYHERVALLGTAGPTGDAEEQKQAILKAFPRLNGRRFFLFISRIHPKKGCDLLIEAFGQLVMELPDDLDLVMAGPDALGWSRELRTLAEKLAIADRVHWTGMLKGDLKWGAFRQADAMILPSHQENFGIVVAESMACSTPVLISNKVNIWREVEASNAGFVEEDSLDGTRALMQRFCLLTDTERKEMKMAARRGYEKHFDIEVTARAFERAIGFAE